MSFPTSVKTEVLTRSARRCCVCREYKGVAVEVHHIIPQDEGGADTLENAILLCFDCHSCAGHYNAKHPKGLKYSRDELRKHRDKHWDDVAEGRVAMLNPSVVANVHVRHVLCLDYDIAREILKAEWQNNPFAFRQIVSNRVGDFMWRVLSDDLPYQRVNSIPPGAALSMGGRYPYEGFWDTREALIAANPTFSNVNSRPLTSEDFTEDSVPSKFLRDCALSCDPAELGCLVAEEVFCGRDGWILEYRVRRPAFVFTEVWNRSSHDIRLVGGNAIDVRPDPITVQPIDTDICSANTIQYPNVLLAPDEAVAIPQMVVLTNWDKDDLSVSWLDGSEIEHAEFDAWGFSSEATSDALAPSFLRVGPLHKIHSLEIIVDGQQAMLDVHSFDLNRLYVADRFWLCGSCPHVIVELKSGELEYLGEVLDNGWCAKDNSVLKVPKNAVALHICEFEFETTFIEQVTVGGRSLVRNARPLQMGDRITIPVTEDDIVEISGSYFSALGHPAAALQRRQKRTLLSAGLGNLASALRTA